MPKRKNNFFYFFENQLKKLFREHASGLPTEMYYFTVTQN